MLLRTVLFCAVLCYAMLCYIVCSRYVLSELGRAVKARVTIFVITLNMMQCRRDSGSVIRVGLRVG
jgi:hypothetical protein